MPPPPQDTNVAQYEFVRLLAGKDASVFTVGDANQVSGNLKCFQNGI